MSGEPLRLFINNSATIAIIMPMLISIANAHPGIDIKLLVLTLVSVSVAIPALS